MARTFTRASGDYYGLVSQTPVLLENSGVNTVHAWFKTSRTDVNCVIAAVSDHDTSGASFIWLAVRGDQTSDPVQYINGGNKNVKSSNTYSTTGWNHAVGVGRSTSSRDIYLNGTKTSNTDAHTVFGGPLTKTFIGGFERTDVSASNYAFDGDIAEVAMWDVALSDEEVAALYAGVSPLLIRPANLKGYWPLWATHPLIDVAPAGDGNTLTANGTPSAATTHPPVVPFSRKMFTSPLAAPAIVLPSIHLAPTERLVVVSTGTTWKVK